ncbi:MAG: ATP-binding protein [Balneolaceae bacterium]
MTRNQTYSIKVNASTRHLAKVRNFVEKYADKFGFDEKTVSDIRLAVDEACTNIIKHAYQFDESKDVEIKLGFKDDWICISLTDQGNTFNPESYSKPDIQKQMKLKKRGGVGVYLIRQLMDDVEYLKKDNSNEIRMYKKRS